MCDGAVEPDDNWLAEVHGVHGVGKIIDSDIGASKNCKRYRNAMVLAFKSVMSQQENPNAPRRIVSGDEWRILEYFKLGVFISMIAQRKKLSSWGCSERVETLRSWWILRVTAMTSEFQSRRVVLIRLAWL